MRKKPLKRKSLVMTYTHPHACGEHPLRFGQTSRKPVHPHACGEHPKGYHLARHYCGSSPRLWGTGAAEGELPHHCRFIPTPVGNTKRRSATSGRMAVHPHACGEHAWLASLVDSITGSSPRLWGTRLHLHRQSENRRFIPTPVGNTSWSPTWWATVSVHPHACGEHSILTGLRTGEAGSSPRLWGTPQFTKVCLALGRFIPTPVGNTNGGIMATTETAVHPHACGEHD